MYKEEIFLYFSINFFKNQYAIFYVLQVITLQSCEYSQIIDHVNI